MDYTLEEIVVETHINSTIILAQGFNQGLLEVSAEVVNIDIKRRFYPNPTISFLIVELEENVNAYILVYDINGKLVIKDRLNDEKHK